MCSSIVFFDVLYRGEYVSFGFISDFGNCVFGYVVCFHKFFIGIEAGVFRIFFTVYVEVEKIIFWFE